MSWATCLMQTLLVGAIAQSEPNAIQGSLQEDLYDQVEISGAVLVGASLGVTSNLEPENARVSLPERAGALSVCVNFRTRDGRYRAAFEGEAPPGASGELSLAPSPDWDVSAVLSDYDPIDVAVISTLGDGCNINPQAPISPVRVGAGSILTIGINSQRATSSSATLTIGDQTLSSECESDPAKRSVTFTALCRFDLQALADRGEASLVINRRTRIGPAQDQFTLILPQD